MHWLPATQRSCGSPLNTALELAVQPVHRVHALQNHGEMTYELTHFADTHRGDRFRFRGVDRRGDELAQLIRTELVRELTGPAAPYSQTFTTNGIASTRAHDLRRRSAIPDW